MNYPIEVVAECYRVACRLDVQALKPGNVSVYAEGHGLTVDQFLISAEVSANALIAPSSSVGGRIYNAVQATHVAVAENTNLGIILLVSPLIEALVQKDRDTPLRDSLQNVLAELTVEDAQECYRAIRLVKPGGMGRVAEQDIDDLPDVTLFEAMQLADQRDRIAYQYTHAFTDIFEYNLAVYRDYLKKWGSYEWVATAVFLSQWLRVPDSLISRKHGILKAQEISDMIAPLANQVLASQDPMAFESRLLSIDGHLKSIGMNPGTTADLTVATLFVAMLESASMRGIFEG